MKALTMALAASSLAACTTFAEADPPAGACAVEPLGALVGQAPNEALGVEAMRLSGARSLRWIRPGDAVTMDYRPDRLNVKLGGDHRVEGFSCG